jgi:hypothetical protein
MNDILNMKPGNYRENLFGAKKTKEERVEKEIKPKATLPKQVSPKKKEIESKPVAAKPETRLDNFMKFMDDIDDELTSQQERVS